MAASASDIREAYQRFGPALLRKAERMLGSSDDAEDVVHSLFAELFSRGHGDRATDLPYLYRAVTNRCLNIIRDVKRRRELLAREPSMQAQPRFESRLEQRTLDVDLLAKLVDQLDRKSLDVLICRFVDEMSQVEIAEHLSVSRKTVGKRLKAIREVLRQVIEEAA